METYLETLDTLDEKIEALDRFTTWAEWTSEEWTPEFEAEYNHAIYLTVLYTVQRDGFTEYTAEDLENYRRAAA
jgi:hypothetical protein